MKVKQLIKQLQKLDPELRVVIRGYEGGVDDAIRLEEYMVKLDVNEAWYYGAHETSDDADTPVVEIVGGSTE